MHHLTGSACNFQRITQAS